MADPARACLNVERRTWTIATAATLLSVAARAQSGYLLKQFT